VRTVLTHSDNRRADPAGVVTAALAVALVVGSAVLWIGIPVLGLWLAGRFTSTAEGFLFATLGGIPVAMVAFGWVLYRVNALYLRSRGPDDDLGRGHSAWLVSLSDERGRSRRARAPRRLIDVAMTVSLTVALVLMAIWFFFLSQMWLVNPL
jgi:preprotein translocase subunit Sec61beta